MLREDYITLCQTHHLPVFFQPWWLDLLCSNWQVAASKQKGIVVAVWIFSFEKKWGFSLIRNPLLSPYLGPYFLFENIDKGAALADLLKQIPKTDFFHVACHPSIDKTDFFLKNGFIAEEKITYRIHLNGKTEEEIFKKIKDSRRSLIRKGEKNLIISSNLDNLSTLLSLHRETYTRKGLPYSFSSEKLALIISESMVHRQGTLLYIDQNDARGFSFCPYDQQTMYLLLTAIDELRKHPAIMSYLVWENIRKAHQMGLSTFDFEGSKDDGIATFFRSFGGEKTTYYSFSRTNSWLWKLKQKWLH
ncbi:MAG: GNAT family N-acetyltransferase [Bacteroidetes bacterium]|nr:GNAT family N-acetyltransferase [Bacteroidota bacterium]